MTRNYIIESTSSSSSIYVCRKIIRLAETSNKRLVNHTLMYILVTFSLMYVWKVNSRRQTLLQSGTASSRQRTASNACSHRARATRTVWWRTCSCPSATSAPARCPCSCTCTMAGSRKGKIIVILVVNSKLAGDHVKRCSIGKAYFQQSAVFQLKTMMIYELQLC